MELIKRAIQLMIFFKMLGTCAICRGLGCLNQWMPPRRPAASPNFQTTFACVFTRALFSYLLVPHNTQWLFINIQRHVAKYTSSTAWKQSFSLLAENERERERKAVHFEFEMTRHHRNVNSRWHVYNLLCSAQLKVHHYIAWQREQLHFLFKAPKGNRLVRKGRQQWRPANDWLSFKAGWW